MSVGAASSSATWSHEPARFDLGQTQSALERWLRERRPEHRDLAIVDLAQPTANGGTGDNLLVTLRYGASEKKIVARLAPIGLSHIHEVSIEQHFRVLQTLESTPVPSPRPLWLENDPDVLGVPFMVMTFVPGRAPSDFPIYNESGFLFDATPAYRRAVWDAAMDALATVHRLDAGLFGFLDRPDRGADGLAQHVAYLREAFTQSPIREPNEQIERALDWAAATMPASHRPGFAWGDPRIGNILFDADGVVRALLDWDQASLAGPLADLGWWLLFDRLHGEDYGKPRLVGLGNRGETIERWQELTGRRAENLEWYEILAGLRLAIVRFRGIKARELRGLWVPGPDNPRSWQSLMARLDSMIAAYAA
jgi:aminoglycoside phosphotransferase (APT) family kinase protein